MSHAYALYVESGDRVAMLDWFVFSTESAPPRIPFRDFITRLAPKTWKEVVFGFSLYQRCIPEWTMPDRCVRKDPLWIDPIQNWPRFRPTKIVDALLNDSRGGLIWAEQLHGLYLVCDANREAAIRFRKALHGRRPEAQAQLDDLHLPDGTSLEEVIDERMLFGFTRHPDYAAFALLTEHFVS